MWQLIIQGLTALGAYANADNQVAPSEIDFSSYEEISSRKRLADYALAGQILLGLTAGGTLIWFSRKTTGSITVIMIVMITFILLISEGIKVRNEKLKAFPYDPADYGDPTTWKYVGTTSGGNIRWTGPPGTEPYDPITGNYRQPRSTRYSL